MLPPPLPPRRYPEVVRVEEDEPPPTPRERPAEPFLLQPSHAQLMRQLEASVALCTEVLSNQRKMARQTDGLLVGVNARFDIFHRELALLRGGAPDPEPEPATEPSRGLRAFVTVLKYVALAVCVALVARAIVQLLGTVGL
jgi:hypothetical protein